MKNLKTEWLYYQSKYKYVLDKSEHKDRKYLLMMPDRIAFIEYLKQCELSQFIAVMVNIFKDRYPIENRILSASLKKENYRDLNDIEPVIFDFDDVFYLISYTIIFKEEQSEILILIENVLSDKQVSISNNEDETIFTVANSPIKELIVSNKRLTLNVNEDFIDKAISQNKQ